MEKSNIEIRLEKKEEHQKVENLVRESFWMCIVQDALSRLGDLAVFSSCSFVISNKRLTSYRLVTII